MRGSRLLIVLLVLGLPVARGDPLQHEFLLLPSAEVAGVFDRHAPASEIEDVLVKADMIFSLQKGSFKVYGEYLVTNHEADLERFQLGWQLSEDTVVWIGRYHQPTSVWNHDHHHGQYLQTSVTRPAIDEWEDLGGVLPQHFTGVLIESSRPVFGTWRLRTAAAGGIAPQITSEGLEPFDLIHPDGNRHQMGYQARASLHPGDFSETGVGVLVANDQLTSVGTLPLDAVTGFDHVNLKLFAVFATYAAADWKLLSAVYYADAQLDYAVFRHHDSFIVGYMQFQQRLGLDLTGFVRWEDSSRAGESAYLERFEEFARSRYVGGLRWDFESRQAFTLQLGKSHTLSGAYSDVRLQWSAALF